MCQPWWTKFQPVNIWSSLRIEGFSHHPITQESLHFSNSRFIPQCLNEKCDLGDIIGNLNGNWHQTTSSLTHGIEAEFEFRCSFLRRRAASHVNPICFFSLHWSNGSFCYHIEYSLSHPSYWVIHWMVSTKYPRLALFVLRLWCGLHLLLKTFHYLCQTLRNFVPKSQWWWKKSNY